MSFEFHDGERIVQSRLGLEDRAARVRHSIHDQLPPVAAQFLARQPFVVLGGASAGQVWASLLFGRPGFATAADPRIVRVRGVLAATDPLSERLATGGDLGTLWIDLAERQRMRINGHARPVSGGFEIEVTQAYSNCPQYITPRAMPGAEVGGDRSIRIEGRPVPLLERRHVDWIRNADTFFIATRHPHAGADASHRGGPSGFVGVQDDGALEWSDYQGNGMFNTLGNLIVDPRAGLLFVDFETGGTLQLTGRATIEWGGDGAGDRRVRFQVVQAVETRRSLAVAPAPDAGRNGRHSGSTAG